MRVTYDPKFDLLYLEFDGSSTPVRNEDVTEGVVLDLTEDGRLAGIEILDASRHLDLSRLLPVEFVTAGASPGNRG